MIYSPRAPPFSLNFSIVKPTKTTDDIFIESLIIEFLIPFVEREKNLKTKRIHTDQQV